MPIVAPYQPLRFYDTSTGYDKFVLYENLHSLKHAAILVPNVYLMMFQLEVPLDIIEVTEWKIKCMNGNLKFNCLTHLKDSLDIQLRTYYDAYGELKQQIIYFPLSGFESMGVQINAGREAAYFYLKLKKSDGSYKEYNSDIIILFNGVGVPPELSEEIDDELGII